MPTKDELTKRKFLKDIAECLSGIPVSNMSTAEHKIVDTLLKAQIVRIDMYGIVRMVKANEHDCICRKGSRFANPECKAINHRE